MTEASREDMVLEKIVYIYYPLRYCKDKENEMQTLINSGNKVNIMMLVYASKLDLRVRRTNVGAQKIDGSTFKTFEMVLASFQVENSIGRSYFFKKPFYWLTLV